MDNIHPTSIPTAGAAYAQIIDNHYFGFGISGNIQPLNDVSTEFWVATAQFSSPKTRHSKSSHTNIPAKHNHHLQKHAVRQLLDSLIQQIAKPDELACLSVTENPSHQTLNSSHIQQATRHIEHHELWLDESNFPYRLQPAGYYVSFSHSKNTVACAISKYKPIGIDLELNSVPLKIAQRFYSDPETDWLDSLNGSYQQQATDLLWMLKEATIKKSSSNNAKSTLMSGLKQNLLWPAQQLFNQIDVTQRDLIQTKHIGNLAAATDKQSLLTHYDGLLYIYMPYRHLVIAV